jgi:hypothetical protein
MSAALRVLLRYAEALVDAHARAFPDGYYGWYGRLWLWWRS